MCFEFPRGEGFEVESFLRVGEDGGVEREAETGECAVGIEAVVAGVLGDREGVEGFSFGVFGCLEGAEGGGERGGLEVVGCGGWGWGVVRVALGFEFVGVGVGGHGGGGGGR